MRFQYNHDSNIGFVTVAIENDGCLFRNQMCMSYED